MHTNSYLVIAGSTRPMRRSPTIAQWVADLGTALGGEPFRVIDIRNLGLGFDDEPDIPAAGRDYRSAATRNWSLMVREAKGVVIVTPQYNWGYPAPLKNAIDHLYREWKGKPVLVVTYGGHGGGKCAAQLREVLTGMGVALTETTPGLRIARERVEANDGGIDPETDFATERAGVQDALRELVALSGAPANPT